MCGLSLWCADFSLWWLLLLWSTGSGHACFISCGSQALEHRVVVPRLSCSAARGIFPDQGLNPCLLHWQADSLPLSQQENPGHAALRAWSYCSLLCLAKQRSYYFLLHPKLYLRDVIQCRGTEAWFSFKCVMHPWTGMVGSESPRGCTVPLGELSGSLSWGAGALQQGGTRWVRALQGPCFPRQPALSFRKPLSSAVLGPATFAICRLSLPSWSQPY